MYQYHKIKLPDGSTRDEHRIVMEKYLGRRLKRDECVHHINGDRKDNRIENLEVIILPKHSSLHFKPHIQKKETRQKLSELNRGEGHPQSKLTPGKVMNIRNMINQGYGVLEIAHIYNLSGAVISHIKTRKRWAHI